MKEIEDTSFFDSISWLYVIGGGICIVGSFLLGFNIAFIAIAIDAFVLAAAWSLVGKFAKETIGLRKRLDALEF